MKGFRLILEFGSPELRSSNFERNTKQVLLTKECEFSFYLTFLSPQPLFKKKRAS